MRKYFGWKAIILRRVPFINFQTVIRVIISLSHIHTQWRPTQMTFDQIELLHSLPYKIQRWYHQSCFIWLLWWLLIRTIFQGKITKKREKYRIVNPKKPYFPSLKTSLESSPKPLMFIESIRLFLVVHLKVYIYASMPI